MAHTHSLITSGAEEVTLVREERGLAVTPIPTPLTRLNYFDGKLLRAADLRTEQEYLRQIVMLSNQAVGPGVAYGFDLTLAVGDGLLLGAGLAIDPAGRVLLLPTAETLNIARLIEATRRLPRLLLKRPFASAAFEECTVVTATPPALVPRGTELFLIVLAHVEALCGTEEVFGRICEEACITATNRPYLVEGVLVRALPLTLHTPLRTSALVPLDRRHLRSQVASAYYADEARIIASLISRDGLLRDAWCLGAARTADIDVPIGVLARAGATTTFLDAWTARRERIEASPRRSWAWRMAMRPWDVFLAQVLQFQCQLHDLLTRAPEPGGADDPCAPQQSALDEASKYLGNVETEYRKFLAEPLIEGAQVFALPGGAAALAGLRSRLVTALRPGFVRPAGRVLIQGGIIELPSAGYLPVIPGSGLTVNTQVRALLGEGLDLRFCVVRPDFVPHALEAAQHMDRISLLDGLEDPSHRPTVDVLVPDGEIVTPVVAPPGIGFDATMKLGGSLSGLAFTPTPAAVPTNGVTAAARGAGLFVADPLPTPVFAPEPFAGLPIHGVARAERVGAGGAAFYFAGLVVDAVKTIDAPRGVLTLAPDVPVMHTASVAGASLAAAVAAAAGDRIAVGPSDEPTSRQAARGLSMTLRTEADPFTLRPSDVTPMNAELIRALAPGDHQTAQVASARWFGMFRVIQGALKTLNGLSMTGRFSGVRIESVITGTAGTPDVHVPIEYAVKLFRAALTDNDDLTVEFTEVGPETPRTFRVMTSWRGRPLQVGAVLQPGLPGVGGIRAFDLLVLRLTESAAAMQLGSQSRREATQAINLIASLMNAAGKDGTAFADHATNALFPPLPPPTAELTVRATRDWVLFHRRRDKTCVRQIERPVMPPRHYQLYHFKITDTTKLDALRKILQTPAGLDPAAYPYQAVDVVEYAGGLATLLSDSRAILADWRAGQPGARLLYGAVATPAAVDPAWLASDRLTRVVELVSAVTPLDAAYDAEVLPQVPAQQAVQGTDGILFLVTYDVATTCQDAYRFLSEIDLSNPDLHPNTILHAQAQRLGIVEFVGNSLEVSQQTATDLANRWHAYGDGTAAQVAVFANRDSPDAADPMALLARANAILAAIGAPPAPPIQPRLVATEWPLTCPVMVVARVQPAAPATTCHAVYRVVVDLELKDALITSTAPLPLARVLARQGFVELLGTAHFALQSSQLSATEQTALSQAWDAAGKGGVRQVIVVAKPGDSGGADQLAARGTAIADAVGATGFTTVARTPSEAAAQWPVECPAVTLLLVSATGRVLAVDETPPPPTGGRPGRTKINIVSALVSWTGILLDTQPPFPSLAQELLKVTATGKFVELALAFNHPDPPGPFDGERWMSAVEQLRNARPQDPIFATIPPAGGPRPVDPQEPFEQTAIGGVDYAVVLIRRRG